MEKEKENPDDNFTFDLVFDAGHVNVHEKFSCNVRLFLLDSSFIFIREIDIDRLSLNFWLVGKNCEARELSFYRSVSKSWTKRSYLRRIVGVSNDRVRVRDTRS